MLLLIVDSYWTRLDLLAMITLNPAEVLIFVNIGSHFLTWFCRCILAFSLNYNCKIVQFHKSSLRLRSTTTNKISTPTESTNYSSALQHHIIFNLSTMTLTNILRAAILSSKKVVPKTIQSPSSTVALPLSSMAVAYASSLPSKPITQDHQRKQEQAKRIGEERLLGDNSKTKRFYHDFSVNRSHQRLPVIIESSSDPIIDPFLGNLLEGFCNGSCYNTGTRWNGDLRCFPSEKGKVKRCIRS